MCGKESDLTLPIYADLGQGNPALSIHLLDPYRFLVVILDHPHCV